MKRKPQHGVRHKPYVPPEKIQAAVRALSKASPSSANQRVKRRFVEIVAEQQGWSSTKALNWVRDHARYASPLPARTRSHSAPRPRERRRSHPGRRQGSKRVSSSRGDPDPPGDESDHLDARAAA
jgi:hypothetical protein